MRWSRLPPPNLPPRQISPCWSGSKKQPDRFQSVRSLNESEFLRRHALLFASTEEAEAFSKQFAQAQALFQVLVGDPSLRGLVQALTFALAGIQRKMFTLDDMARPLTMYRNNPRGGGCGRTSQRASHGGNWLTARRRPKATCGASSRSSRCSTIARSSRASAATSAIRQAAADLGDLRAKVRLTGPVAIQDEEFGDAEGELGAQYRGIARLPDRNPVAGARLRAHHRSCADQHLRRTCNHRRFRAVDGGSAQSDLDRLCGSVRRHRRRFRHPVRGALSRGASRERRSARRLDECRAARRRAADIGRDRNSGRLHVVRPDRLQGAFRTGADRWRRHDHRVPGHDHALAGLAAAVQSAG